MRCRTVLPVGNIRRTSADVADVTWQKYFEAATEAAEYKSSTELARASGVDDGRISKWRRGEPVPDLESCRKLARAWKRPILEVLVAAGHLNPDEARIRRPEPPPVPSRAEARAKRIADFMDSLPTGDARRDLLDKIFGAGEVIADIRHRDAG
jgi:transcriptional regulator with XRE-family HTH domain